MQMNLKTQTHRNWIGMMSLWSIEYKPFLATGIPYLKMDSIVPSIGFVQLIRRNEKREKQIQNDNDDFDINRGKLNVNTNFSMAIFVQIWMRSNR